MVRNITKNTILSQNVRKALSFKDNAFGMIDGKNGSGLIISTHFGIHTFFMKFPIDVIVLDKNKKVQKLKTVKPWQIFVWNPKFSVVIELPNGIIRKTKTEVGDRLDF
ncbi:MAG TPA: DUF192 domain-containing protein [Patescibacteria group bacterium]|nr:DUF192 domain-containing protein [Patescibacteria group bacterium]